MTAIYIVGPARELAGPFTLPVVPGIGRQMPEEAIELANALAAPADGYTWALVDNMPQQLVDHRGLVYSTEDGTERHYEHLGDLPNGLTEKAWPGRFYVWSGGSWVLDDVAKTEAAYEVERVWRNEQIAATDYLAMPDYPINTDKRSELYAYRQALRDWPNTGQFPEPQDRPRPPTWVIEQI